MNDNSAESFRGQLAKKKPFSYRRKVYEILAQRNEPMTDREIIDSLMESDVNNVRPEITRLKQDGILAECGKTKCPHTGKTVRLVKATGAMFFNRNQSKASDRCRPALPSQMALI